MERKGFWIIVVTLVLLSSILFSCTSTTSTPASTAIQSTSTSPSQTSSATPPPASTPSSTSVPITTSPVTTSVVQTTPPPTTQADWWTSKWGTPQYGGTITLQLTAIRQNFDTYSFFPGDWNMTYEALFAQDNSTVDRSVYPFNADFVPMKYFTGQLAKSWELTDPTTLVVNVRQGVYWQNKPPVNGREFVATDVQAHYDRVLFSNNPSVMYETWLNLIQSVKATDKFTVTIKLKQPGVAGLWQIMESTPMNLIEAPEYAALYQPPATTAAPSGGGPPAGGGPPPGGPPIFGAGGPLQDWHNVVGTGAWMLTGFENGVSETLSKNPDYWGYDERYPKNQLPYADTLKALIIPDTSTAIAAFRTGKVDMLGGNGGPSTMNFRNVSQLKTTNSDMQVFKQPAIYSPALSMRVDQSPFNDIRVRQALNMAIDRPAIAKGYYNGTEDATPAGIIIPEYTEFAYPYSEWSQALKDDYSYNPQNAKQLLSEAGYPNGFKTTILAPTNSDLDLLQVLQSQLANIGVDMQIQTQDPVTFQTYVIAKKENGMIYAGGTTNAKPVNAIWRYQSQDANLNVDTVNDPAYDALVTQFNAAMTESDAAAAMQAADKLALEKAYTVWVFPIHTYVVTQPYLKGYDGEELMWNHWYYNTARLWITQSP